MDGRLLMLSFEGEVLSTFSLRRGSVCEEAVQDLVGAATVQLSRSSQKLRGGKPRTIKNHKPLIIPWL